MTRWICFDPKLSLDGLLTFAGGFLAFVAILIQIRHADKGLLHQLNAEKEKVQGERRSRTSNCARAILFEIDSFYVSHLLPARQVFHDFEKKRVPSFDTSAEALEVNHFPVYLGNSAVIGDFEPDVARLVIHFYSEANTYFALVRAHEKAVQNKDSQAARIYFEHTKENVSGAIRLGYRACFALSGLCGVKFQAPEVKV